MLTIKLKSWQLYGLPQTSKGIKVFIIIIFFNENDSTKIKEQRSFPPFLLKTSYIMLITYNNH